MGEENPYAGPESDVGGWRRDRATNGISVRGVLVGLPVAVFSMLGAGLVFGLIATATVTIDLEAAARDGGGTSMMGALVSQIPYARFFSLLVWSVGIFSGGYVAAGYSRDRQLTQGLLVGAMIYTFLLFLRLVSGGSGFAAEDLVVLSFVAVGALGGGLRGMKVERQ